MLNILFCKWTSICEDGIEHGFNTLGHRLTIIDRLLDSVDYDTEYAGILSNTLLDRSFDCVFSVNYIPIISRVCNIHKVPYLSWTVDSPCFQLYSKTITNAYNHIFMFDRDQYNQFCNDNPSGIHHFPLGTDVDFWNSINVTEAEHKSYDCDISFIGSLYSEKCRYNQLTDLPDYISGYVNGLVDAQLSVFGYNFIADSLTDDFIKEFKSYVKWLPLGEDYNENDRKIIADTYIGYKCTEQDRIRTLNSLTNNYNVDLYTLSDTSMLPKIHNKGPADSISMMPKIIKSSKINLNFTNKPISSGLPLRIFDIMGCGGFLISNYQPEISELFEIDKDIVVYESIDDLIQKVDYYLHHEDKRMAIAKSGYNKVKTYFSYANRLKEMLDIALS